MVRLVRLVLIRMVLWPGWLGSRSDCLKLKLAVSEWLMLGTERDGFYYYGFLTLLNMDYLSKPCCPTGADWKLSHFLLSPLLPSTPWISVGLKKKDGIFQPNLKCKFCTSPGKICAPPVGSRLLLKSEIESRHILWKRHMHPEPCNGEPIFAEKIYLKWTYNYHAKSYSHK